MVIPASTLEELKARKPRILIVGSGPAGTAVAERLYAMGPDATIGVLERGGILSTTHINNLLTDDPLRPPAERLRLDRRSDFIAAFEECVWAGDFNPGGTLVLALGGRGIVAGAHLRRFDEIDFTLWGNGRWPISSLDLDADYTRAELIRHVSIGESEGIAQTWVSGQLSQFKAYPPPWGVDIRSTRNFDVSRGYDSSVTRLLQLVYDDYIRARKADTERRLLIVPNAYVTQIHHDETRVSKLTCQDTVRKDSVELEAEVFVLAASPIESSRLFLYSGLGEKRPVAGRYLAEHIYCRGVIRVPTELGDIHGQSVNVVIPPPAGGRESYQRFQIELRGDPFPEDARFLLLRVTGIAAMEPSPDNQVTVPKQNVEKGDMPMAHIKIRYSQNEKYSPNDRARLAVMQATMVDVVKKLNGKWVKEEKGKWVECGSEEAQKVLDFGRSHHEAGTLRMGYNSEDSVVNTWGQVHGIDNLFVADAAVFPCVGIANPMLTVTAWAYRVAEYICKCKMKEKA
jgi:choline dehydrogenase-like flavoprotein